MSTRYTARPRPVTTSYDTNKGIYIVKPGYDASVLMLTMKMCPLTIRILPVRCWHRDDFDVFLDPTDDSGFGSWFFTGPMVDRIGTWPSTATFLLPIEADAATVASSPVNALVRRCGFYAAEALKSPSRDPNEYRFLVNKRDKDSKDIPPLKAVSNCEMVACMVLEKEGKALQRIQGADGKPVFLVLPKSAGMALKAQFRNELKNNPNFNPIAFDQGCLVTFFEEGKDPRNRGRGGEDEAQASDDMDAALERNADAAEHGSSAFAGKKYSCFISQRYNGIGARITKAVPIFEQSLRSWGDMLHFMPFEQQAQILAELFPPPLVLEALSTHPEWITESLRQSAALYRSMQPLAQIDPGPNVHVPPVPQQSVYGHQPPPPRQPLQPPAPPSHPAGVVYERSPVVMPPAAPVAPQVPAAASLVPSAVLQSLTPEQLAYFNQLHGQIGLQPGPPPAPAPLRAAPVPPPAPVPMARPIPSNVSPFDNDSPAIPGTHGMAGTSPSLPPPPAIAGVFTEEQLHRAVLEIQAKTAAGAAAAQE